LSFDTTSPFSKLLALLTEIFQKELKVKYKDEEGDWITIDSELEWAEAINYGQLNKNILRLSVKDSNITTTAQPSTQIPTQSTKTNTNSNTNPTNTNTTSPSNPAIDIETLLQTYGPLISSMGIDVNSPAIRSLIQNYLQRANPAQVGAFIQQFLPLIQGMAARSGQTGTPQTSNSIPTNTANSNTNNIPTTSTSAPAPAPTSTANVQQPKMTEEEMLSKLVEMGYDRELSKEILDACNGNFSDAVQRLVSLYN